MSGRRRARDTEDISPANARRRWGINRTIDVNGRLASALLVLLPITACTDPPPDSPPRQLTESTFHYPEELWDAGVEGETLLEIHVSRNGMVDSARVERSSGHAEFDSAAISGAHLLRFEPARRGTDSVAVRVHLPVRFHIPNEDEPADAGQPSPSEAATGDTLTPR